MNPEAFLQAHREWRGVEDPCPDCGGSGVRTYSSTSLWRRGISGQAFTNGVCDKCWGSGDDNRPWTDLRKMEATFDDRVRVTAEDNLLRRLGSAYYPKEVFEQIADILETQTRKRKGVSTEFKQICNRLANVLKEMGKQ